MTTATNYAGSIQRQKPSLRRNERESVIAADPDATTSGMGTTALGDAVLLADSRSTVQLSLPLLWWELTRGLCQVVEGFFTDSRCFLVTQPTQPPGRPLEGRRLQVLEAVLCGVGQKSIAIELGLAPSTVALNARLALEGLGVHCKPSRAHPLLMLTAMAGRAQDARMTARLSYLNVAGRLVRIVSLNRPDARLDALPPAELAVVRLLIEGISYENIAGIRGTSTRTIANQITAVFRRMKVSGRNELLSRLLLESTLNGAAPSGLVMTALPPAVRVWEAKAV